MTILNAMLCMNDALPQSDSDIHVLVTFVRSSRGQEYGGSDAFASPYVPYEEFASEYDRLCTELLQMVPEEDLDTVSIACITRSGQEIESYYARPS